MALVEVICPHCFHVFTTEQDPTWPLVGCPKCHGEVDVPVAEKSVVNEKKVDTQRPPRKLFSDETQVLLRLEDQLARISQHVGCIFAMMLVWMILTLIAALIVGSQPDPPRF